MTKVAVPLVAALVFCSTPVLEALDPQRAPSQYVLTKWGPRDLSNGSINAVLQTKDRYLWLGTTTGLVRFDGARFVVFNHRRTPGFEDGGVSSLAEGTDGSLYAGTTAGTVMRYRDGTFTRLSVPAGTGLVSSLLSTRDGGLWVGAHGRPVCRWKDGEVKVFLGKTKVTSPLALAEDDKGTVWLGTPSDGLVRFEDGAFSRQALTHEAVQALRGDRAGALWIGTPHGLWRLHDGRLRRFSHRDGLSHDDVSALLEDRDGNLWIGTAGGGLNRFRDGRFARFTSQEGLTNDHVRSFIEDHEGNLWVATADGLNCLSDGRFMTYGRLEGLRDPSVTAVAEAADGSVWIGMNSGGLARLREGRLRHFSLPGGVGRDRIIALYESRDGSVWAAVDNGRLFRIKNGTIDDHTPTAAAKEGKVRLVLEDGEGPVFFVGDVGLARIRSGRVVPLPSPSVRYAHAAYRDAEGTLWLGTSAGLARLGVDGQRLYTPKDGLPRHRVRSVVGDDDGLWMATSGGLVHFKDETLRTVTTAHGLPENYLRLVLDDGLGHLWIASTGHIFRVAKRELLDLFQGRASQVSPVVFDTTDGLRATEAPLGNSPGFRGRDGRLWFATAQGASVVDPSRLSVDDPAPPVRVESITVDRSLGPRDEYPPGRGEVTIEYTALAFRSWSKLFFRHRLDGFDHDWVRSDRRSAYYSNLAPGRYQFFVMASNRDGVWMGEPMSLTFVIRPPFYRTPLFYAACVGATLGLVFAAHRFRVRQMHARLTATIDERTRIARELHDTLAQSLAGLGIQIDAALGILPEEPALERVRRQLRLGLSMVRSSLAEVRRSIWVLRAHTSKAAADLPSSLRENLAHLTSDAGIALSLQVTGEPRSIAPDLERSLLRIAHEAVTNAVRHAAPKRIAVDLHFDPDHLRLRVTDDGQGFDPDAASLEGRNDRFGLVGIRERARALGGDLRLSSRPGAGTDIECRLPYRHRLATAEAHSADGASL